MDDILTRIKKEAIECFDDMDFVGLVGVLPIRGRIVCGEVRRKDGLHGISFWIHSGNVGDFLGLWSGRVYKVRDHERLVAMITHLMSGEAVPKGRPPWILPDSVTQKFELVEVED